MTLRATFLAILVLGGTAAAQESAGFQAEENVLNAGGHPSAGVTPSSASYRISLDSLGEGIVWATLTGPSFRLDGGAGATARPPGEVTGVVWNDPQAFAWDVEPAALTYRVYRGALGDVAGPGYGDCAGPAVVDTQATDATVPPSGDGFFYLITARNGLSEEGPKGRRSDGTPRAGNVCP